MPILVFRVDGLWGSDADIKLKQLRRYYLKPAFKEHIIYGKDAFVIGEGKNNYRVALVSGI